MKELKDFSWSVLFFVTGFSSLLFSLIIKLLEGSFSKPFLWVGFGALFLGLLDLAGKLLAKSASGKHKRKTYS
jgi:hypothetical protein